MKVILLKDFDIGLTRIRVAGSELDLDPELANRLIDNGTARKSETELLAEATAAPAPPPKRIIFKPANSAEGGTANDAKAKS